MAQVLPGNSAKVVQISSWKTCLVGILVLMLCVAGKESAQATTGDGGSNPPKPYEVPTLTSSGGSLNITITADEATVDIGDGNGAITKVMTFNGTIPGPELRLKVGDHVTVHFVNNLEQASGIHWHGIELNNASDGTELTQLAVAAHGEFTYDFIVRRPGIFWYHPHHHGATNQVFKGLYGSIIVEDKDDHEATLIAQKVIPSAEHTKTLVLSDITVCKGSGNPETFAADLPHVSGVQAWQGNYSDHSLTQSPYRLCKTDPLDDDGVVDRSLSYGAGDVPNIQSSSLIGRMSEGFTVLTNGVQVDARGGNPSAPADPSDNVLANALPVQAGQGLRLQIVNPSPVRYMRLRLTDSRGWQIPLVRIGGEGGLLNNARVEGGLTASNFNMKYDRGEILIPPAGRADVVAEIPASAAQGSVLTLWTQDFQRVLATWSWTPTVPVMHLKINERTPFPYRIAEGRALRASLGRGAMVKVLRPATDDLVLGEGEQGLVDKDIKLSFSNSPIDLTEPANAGAFQPTIDGIPMPRDFTGGEFDMPYNPFFLASARHAKLENTLELTVTNWTGAHHPFHLHGFSFQPIKMSPRTGTAGPSYTFSPEFLDIMDVPAHHTFTLRVSLDDRPMKDSTDVNGIGGGKGRWLFHCHILPHATFGMMSELHVGAHQ